jgi:Na+/phosphate symporter
MTIYLSLLCALVGLLMYALSSNPKLQEIGRLSFFAGLLAFLIRVSDAAFQIIK